MPSFRARSAVIPGSIRNPSFHAVIPGLIRNPSSSLVQCAGFTSLCLGFRGPTRNDGGESGVSFVPSFRVRSRHSGREVPSFRARSAVIPVLYNAGSIRNPSFHAVIPGLIRNPSSSLVQCAGFTSLCFGFRGPTRNDGGESGVSFVPSFRVRSAVIPSEKCRHSGLDPESIFPRRHSGLDPESIFQSCTMRRLHIPVFWIPWSHTE